MDKGKRVVKRIAVLVAQRYFQEVWRPCDLESYIVKLTVGLIRGFTDGSFDDYGALKESLREDIIAEIKKKSSSEETLKALKEAAALDILLDIYFDEERFWDMYHRSAKLT